MSEALESFSASIKKCPVCGKMFTVLWPHLWAYKRGPGEGKYKYMCSYGCIRKFDKGVKQKMPGGHRVLTDEMKKEAIRIAQDGGNPLPYLGKCGSKNPSAAWSNIRTSLKETDPDEYAKLPKVIRTGARAAKAKKAETGSTWAETVDAFYSHKEPEPSIADAMEGMQNAANDFFGACKDMGLMKAETPEQPEIPYKVTGTCLGMNFKIRSIQTDLGTYSVDGEYFEFKSAYNKNDNLEMPIEEMVTLAKELPEAMKFFGVEV